MGVPRGRLTTVLAAALATVATLTGPAVAVPAAAGDAAPPRSRTLVVALLQDVDALNPFTGSSAPAALVFRLTYDYLTDYDPADNHPVPALARSWTTSPDGLTWTFRLRDDVRWPDGQPLTAADVAFTYRTLLAHRSLANAALLRNVTAVTTPDAHTVVLRTSAPTATMLALDVPIVAEHAWRGVDPAQPVTGPGPTAAGSGPFVLAEAHPGSAYRFVRNAGHRPAAPGVDQLVIRVFTSSDAAVQALRRGDVDVVNGLTPAQYGSLAGDRRVVRNVARGTRLTELGINSGARRPDGTPVGDGHPALRDLRVRTAIDHAIDRDTLVARVLGGLGDPGQGYLPGTTPWAWRPGPGERRGFDLAAANRLLDAGYPRGPDGIRRMPGGRPLDFRLYVPSGRAHYEQSATYLTAWLRQAGIAVHPQLLGDSDKGERVAAGDFDLFLGGWITDPDPDYLLSVQTCGARPAGGAAGTTDTWACDPAYDALDERQAHELDTTRRVALVKDMQRRLYQTVPLTVLYYPGVLEAYRADHFTGFVRRPAADGSITGAWSYAHVRPVVAAGGRPDGGAPWAGILAVGAAVLLAGPAIVAVRRRATRHLRE